jgi:hypothetical protein
MLKADRWTNMLRVLKELLQLSVSKTLKSTTGNTGRV